MADPDKITIEYVPISKLTFDPTNARKHSKRNLDAIVESLREFGQVKPIVIAKDPSGSLVVVAGNGTLEAAKVLGWSKISAKRVPDSWDAERIKAYALVDNRTAELAEWDLDVLSGQLVELDSLGWNMDALGFDPVQSDPLDDETIDGQDVEPPAVPFSVLGDVWVCGKHRVVCGDSTHPSTYERLIDEPVGMVWTDPPYGVAIVGGNHALSPEQRKARGGKTIQNDSMKPAQLREFLRGAFTSANDHVAAGGVWYVAAPAGDLFHEFASVLYDLKLWRHTLVWAKDSLVMGRADYHYRHEAIFYGWKEGAAHTWNGGRKQDTILEVPRPKRSKDHPTMKPVALIIRCIENSSNADDIVLDPFGGSGEHVARRRVNWSSCTSHRTRPRLCRRDLSPVSGGDWCAAGE